MAAKLTAIFAILASYGCSDTYVVRPRDTATITRAFATPEQVEAMCRIVTGQPNRAACTLWSGDRSIQILPYSMQAGISGHEVEHSYSGAFHQ